MPNKKNAKQSQSDIIQEAELAERVPLLCPKLNFDGYIVELVAFGLHPSFVPDSSLTHHIHSHIEIHAVFSGNGIVTIGQDSYSFGTGQFSVSIPHVIHYTKMGKKPPSMLIISIKTPEPVDYLISDAQRLFKNLLEATDVVYTTPESFESLYRNIVNELKTRSLGYVDIIRALLKVMILDLARNAAKEKAVKSHIALPKTTPFRKDRIVENINNFIKHNLSVKIHLKMMTKTMYTSERNLTRHYKQVTDMTIGQKINQLRMARAEELVRETKLSAKAIAYDCGFSSGTYFSKQFKKQFNLSPIEYRNQITDSDDLKEI